jgi:hypothetical protein
MRLTLRTLLAYLDDTLEPSQAKLIGQKVAESDTAQELIARIKQVTRRRRLTIPPATGPGSKLDPNAAAEYLDNTLNPDQMAEVEQIALSSDVHLAEIAACHQILTLVVGEPALIPPSSRQRMYGLVKGREAVPFRKPQGTAAENEPEAAPDLETDETLRLGLPAYRARGSWSSQLAVVGGGLAAALILALAVWQALRQRGGSEVAENRKTSPTEARSDTQTGHGTKDTRIQLPDPKEKGKGKPEDGGTHEDNGGAKGKTSPDPKGNGSNEPDGGRVDSSDVPLTPPDNSLRAVGQLVKLAAAEPALLVQGQTAKDRWNVVDPAKKVFAGRPLVALPGFQGTIETKNGLRLQLWGALPEVSMFRVWPVVESRVQFHTHPDLELDLTLQRGRLFLSNPQARPLLARVRWDNPTNPEVHEFWDLTLEGPGTEVLVELTSYYPRDEPFFPDANNPRRKGPHGKLRLLVTKGAVSLRVKDDVVRMAQAVGPNYREWDSQDGTGNGRRFDPVPFWAAADEELPPDFKDKVDPRVYKDLAARVAAVQQGRDRLAKRLAAGELGVALEGGSQSPDPAERALVVLCYGALDDLASLVDRLEFEEREPSGPETRAATAVRQAAIVTLRGWIAQARDNDYKLFAELRAKQFSVVDASIMLKLLHSLSMDEVAQPATFESLIGYLDNPKLAIRELAAWHLYQLAPAGRNISYLASAPEPQRQQAQKEWRKLLQAKKIGPQ